MKQSSLMGKDRVRHSSLNVEGSDFYKKMIAEAKAKEEKEKLGSSDEVKEEEGGDGEEEEEEVLEAALNFFEDQGWADPTLKNNFFEDHEEFDAQEEAEDEAGELPRHLKFNFNNTVTERPTIERGESREAKRAYNADPTKIPEED